jgi:hypothetical protein
MYRDELHEFIDSLNDDIVGPALHKLVDTLPDELVPQTLRRMQFLHARLTDPLCEATRDVSAIAAGADRHHAQPPRLAPGLLKARHAPPQRSLS